MKGMLFSPKHDQDSSNEIQPTRVWSPLQASHGVRPVIISSCHLSHSNHLGKEQIIQTKRFVCNNIAK